MLFVLDLAHAWQDGIHDRLRPAELSPCRQHLRGDGRSHEADRAEPAGLLPLIDLRVDPERLVPLPDGVQAVAQVGLLPVGRPFQAPPPGQFMGTTNEVRRHGRAATEPVLLRREVRERHDHCERAVPPVGIEGISHHRSLLVQAGQVTEVAPDGSHSGSRGQRVVVQPEPLQEGKGPFRPGEGLAIASGEHVLLGDPGVEQRELASGRLLLEEGAGLLQERLAHLGPFPPEGEQEAQLPHRIRRTHRVALCAHGRDGLLQLRPDLIEVPPRGRSRVGGIRQEPGPPRIPLGKEQHVLADGLELLIAERANVGRGLQVLRPAHVPPPKGILVGHRRPRR